MGGDGVDFEVFLIVFRRALGYKDARPCARVGNEHVESAGILPDVLAAESTSD